MRIAEYGCGVRGRSQKIGKILGLTIAECIPHFFYLTKVRNMRNWKQSPWPLTTGLDRIRRAAPSGFDNRFHDFKHVKREFCRCAMRSARPQSRHQIGQPDATMVSIAKAVTMTYIDPEFMLA